MSEGTEMKLADFLRVHEGGVACITISANETSATKPTILFCEEEEQEDFMQSEAYQKIADYTVRRFCVIGGGIYKVELCIEVEEGLE